MDPTTKTDQTFSSVEDFVVDGDEGDQGLGFLSSVDDTPTTTGVGQESDRYKIPYLCLQISVFYLKCNFLATSKRKAIQLLWVFRIKLTMRIICDLRILTIL